MKFGNTTKGKYLVLLAHLGALFTVSAWGTSFLCTKVLMIDGGFTPVEIYFYRFLVAYIVLLFFTLKNIRSKSWRDELTFLLCGVCCGSLYFITENYALQLTTAGNVSLLASISPIFTTVLIAVIFRQKIQSGVIIGSIVAFIGAGCIVMSHGDSLEFRPAGDLLALSAALSWAVYSVAIKRVLIICDTVAVAITVLIHNRTGLAGAGRTKDIGHMQVPPIVCKVSVTED